jgi:hypothetical protein
MVACRNRAQGVDVAEVEEAAPQGAMPMSPAGEVLERCHQARIDGGSVRLPVVILADAGDRPSDHLSEEIAANGWRVFNAPRPIPGRLTWTSDFRAGVFYAAGPVEEFGRAWADLHAAEVLLVTTADVDAFIKRRLTECDLTSLEDAEAQAGVTRSDLARSYDLPLTHDTLTPDGEVRRLPV